MSPVKLRRCATTKPVLEECRGFVLAGQRYPTGVGGRVFGSAMDDSLGNGENRLTGDAGRSSAMAESDVTIGPGDRGRNATWGSKRKESIDRRNGTRKRRQPAESRDARRPRAARARLY